ncbi:MAG TPA: HDOD domain-containing protein [Geobacteraceae bacterium]|nr:HDOD domain-containing protein [Geobacteraceae bacterium]
MREEIRKFILDTRTLPTISGIVAKLNSLADNKKSSVREIARLVSSDQVLSARILRLANSPSYGFYRVSTISNAMILLGIDVVKSLVLSSSIFEIMEQNVVGLWEHSLGAGVAANVIAKRLKISDSEELATAALLHDIGKVIIRIKLNSRYDALLAKVPSNGSSLHALECATIGTDHAEVGGWLAKSWFLPEKLSVPISYHHNVQAAPVHQVKAAVVHFSDILIKASGFGFSGDPFVSAPQQAAWEALGMTESLLSEIVEELEEKLLETRNFSLEIQSADETKT